MQENAIKKLAREAREASYITATLSSELKNRVLDQVAVALDREKARIFAANQDDLARAEGDRVAAPLVKRLKFDEKKLQGVIEGIRSLIALEDPVGREQLATELDRGLELHRISTPIGVIGMIFESRPDALVQMAALSLKSGNAVLLKGGREARETNRVLTEIISTSSLESGMPAGWIVNLESREEVQELLGMDREIDLLIPRGSNEFVRYIMENSRIPVMGHADGICHTYIEARANPETAVRIAVDGKAQYVAVCNSTETILIDRALAQEILPLLTRALQQAGVRIRGCAETRAIIPAAEAADEKDWETEYLDYIVSIKVVADLDEAVAHINRYGSGHTDAIVTEDPESARRFMERVDSANVFHNCSTRFSDGFRYGFGAEVGISTGKLHARGPVGLEGLLTYKYKLFGTGQIVADYAEGRKKFTHRSLAKPGEE